MITSQDESISGDLARLFGRHLAVHVDAAILAVVQAAEGLEGGGAGLAKVVDKEIDVKLCGVGGPESHAAWEVPLDARPQRDDPHLRHIHGLRKLDEV